MPTTTQEVAQAAAEAKANKTIAEALTHIDKSMRALVCVELVRVLYGRAELRSLMTDLQKLTDADKVAQEAVTKAYEDAREQRRAEGIDELTEPRIGEQPSAASRALVVCKLTTGRVSVFREAHPLVYELHAAKTPWSS